MRTAESGAVTGLQRRQLALTLLFVVCLIPFSIGSFGANYSFVVLPLALLLWHGRLARPPQLFVGAILLFASLCPLAWLFQPDLLAESSRRLVSFALFMTIFAYAFIHIDARMVAAFKSALIACSVTGSIWAVRMLLYATQHGLDLKETVGSQRYGFVYLTAFWTVLLARRGQGRARIARYGVLLILLVGLLLTFSRSSVVALALSFVTYAIAHRRRWLRPPTPRLLKSACWTAVGVLILATALVVLVPSAVSYFGDRFVRMANWSLERQNLEDPDSSDGTRVYIARSIVSFVAANPVTGSGYLGTWILPVYVGGLRAGSAHSQYLDVLLRTGVFGFLVYGYLLWRTFRYLSRAYPGLCWGFVSVLFYGLFQETFKESQGAFLLTFFLGMLAEAIRTSSALRYSPARASAMAQS